MRDGLDANYSRICEIFRMLPIVSDNVTCSLGTVFVIICWRNFLTSRVLLIRILIVTMRQWNIWGSWMGIACRYFVDIICFMFDVLQSKFFGLKLCSGICTLDWRIAGVLLAPVSRGAWMFMAATLHRPSPVSHHQCCLLLCAQNQMTGESSCSDLIGFKILFKFRFE